MPFTKKGKKILRAMRKKYGKKKGETVFYASANKGTIKGVHGKDAGRFMISAGPHTAHTGSGRFDPSKHPRNKGKFSGSGGASGGIHVNSETHTFHGEPIQPGEHYTIHSVSTKGPATLGAPSSVHNNILGRDVPRRMQNVRELNPTRKYAVVKVSTSGLRQAGQAKRIGRHLGQRFIGPRDAAPGRVVKDKRGVTRVVRA